VIHPGERVRIQQSELHHLASRLRGAARRELDAAGWRFREAGLGLRGAVPDVAMFIRARDDLARRLRDGAIRVLDSRAAVLTRVEAHLRHLDPRQVLERGYSITEMADGTIVRDAARLATGQDVRITLSRGWADARVKRTGS
jgi:exodeoxyribonuclease VII large subunit